MCRIKYEPWASHRQGTQPFWSQVSPSIKCGQWYPSVTISVSYLVFISPSCPPPRDAFWHIRRMSVGHGVRQTLLVSYFISLSLRCLSHKVGINETYLTGFTRGLNTRNMWWPSFGAWHIAGTFWHWLNESQLLFFGHRQYRGQLSSRGGLKITFPQ